MSTKGTEPIHRGFYDRGDYLQAFATNHVGVALPKYVFIVVDEDFISYDFAWNRGQIFIVDTTDNDRVVSGYYNFKPYGMFMPYSLFVDIKDAVSYSQFWK